jgi:hypothetical protein
MGLWDRVRGFFGGKDGEAEAGEEPHEEEEEAAESEPPVAGSPRALFRERVIRMAGELPFIASAEPATDDYAIDVVNDRDEEFRFFLHNLFAETRDFDPEARDAQITRFLSLLGSRPEVPETWEDAAPKLLPVIRVRTFFDISFSGPNPGKRHLVFRPFLPFLSEAIAVDFEGQLQYATSEQLSDWGVDAERAFEQASRNLSRFADDGIEPFDTSAPHPIWHVAAGDAYESSRLALPGWLERFAGKVHGKPVAAIPDRSTLLVTGDGDEASLIRLAETAKREFTASPRSISPVLYTQGDAGTVVPFAGSTSKRLADLLRANQILLAATEYHAQKESLEKTLEERGDDVFVASFMVVERDEDVDTKSIATWGEGVRTLLPFTDLVALGGGNPESDDAWHLLLPWRVVNQHAGHLWKEEPGVDPPRMRTIGWPDAKLIATLQQHAVEL